MKDFKLPPSCTHNHLLCFFLLLCCCCCLSIFLSKFARRRHKVSKALVYIFFLIFCHRLVIYWWVQFLSYFTFYNCIVPVGFLPWEIRVVFPAESQLRQSHATQPTVHAGCFSVSIIHRTLTWTTGSLTCALTLIHAIAHGGVRTHVRESALKVDSGRKIHCRSGESNQHQRRDGPML